MCGEYMSFTPGPWKVKFKKNCYWSIYGADKYSILAIPHDDEFGDTPVDRANAHLVAAAPDMLAALEKCMPLLSAYDGEKWKEVYDLVDGVIMKANNDLSKSP